MDGDAPDVEPVGCGPLPGRAAEPPRALRQAVFETVRALGQVSRAQIAKELRVSPATISTVTADLIETGYLRECEAGRGATEAGPGRPPVALATRPEAHLVAGVKLSDREHTAILVDFAGGQIASAGRAVRPGRVSADDQMAALSGLMADLLAGTGLGRADLSAVGLGVPGFVDHRTGIVHWSPVLAERDVPLARRASGTLGLPVTVDNDANLVALAELWFGVGRRMADFAVVTIEHGVGLGLILDHKLFRGSRGLGLELGHTKVQLDGALCRCGQRGCLEAYVADYALAREAAAAMGAIAADPPQMPQLIERLYAEAQAGNSAAQSIFHRAGRYLSVGLANVTNLFDPSLLILSGERMRYDYLYQQETLAEMQAFALETGRPLPPVEVHAWGDLLWAHGAAALALGMVTEARLGT